MTRPPITGRLVALALCTTVLAACGGSDDPATPPPAACTAPCVDAAGGTITGPAGAGVSVPPGALAGGTTIVITANATPPAPLPGTLAAAGPIVAFEPHGQTFAQPVTISVPLEPAALGTDTPQLVRIGQGQSTWGPVAGATRSGNAMTAQVTSFSWFAVVKAVAAPTIASAPANASALVGQTATFSVTASGSSPFTYQWLRNGATIGGATAASYTTPALTLADNGARYSVTVTNSAGSVTSAEATLTVTAPAPARVDLIGRAPLSPQDGTIAYSTTDKVHLIAVDGVRRTVNFAADGSFRFDDVGALTAPLLLIATDKDDASLFRTAVLRDRPAATFDVYLSNLTAAVAPAAVGKSNSATSGSLAAATAAAAELTPAKVDAALALVRTTFGPLVTAFGGNAQNFDPALSAASAAVNDVVSSNGSLASGLSFWYSGNTRLPDDAGLSLTTLGQPLPAVVVTEVPTIKPLLAALKSCFALPVADRVTVDGQGTITQLKGPCANLPVAAGYSNNLSSFAERYNDWLRDPRLVGADFGAFSLGATSASEIELAVYYFAGNQFDTRYDVLSKSAGGAWLLAGNRRRYEAFAAVEYVRAEYLSPAPSPATSIFGFSRFDVVLNFRFDPTNGTDAAGVRAIRIKGRGLPAAGLVLTRSTSCGRADRLVIANKTGDVSVSSSPNRTTFFYLRADPLVAGGPLGPWTPADPSFADAPLTPEQIRASVLSLEPYRVEVFRGAETTPSDSFTMRVGQGALGGGPLRGNPIWPQLTADTLRYLDPTRPEAAAAAVLPMSWTSTFGPGPINVYAVTRGLLDGVERRVIGGVSFVPGSTTSATLRADVTPPGETNPCAASQFPALTTTPRNFRGFGLFNSYFGARYTAEFYFQTF